MAIVYQHDKRSGITYAYESKSHWDKKKKQSRATRTLIGRVDPDTGEIVPTDGRMRRAREKKRETDPKELSRRIDELERRVEALEERLGGARGEQN